MLARKVSPTRYHHYIDNTAKGINTALSAYQVMTGAAAPYLLGKLGLGLSAYGLYSDVNRGSMTEEQRMQQEQELQELRENQRQQEEDYLREYYYEPPVEKSEGRRIPFSRKMIKDIKNMPGARLTYMRPNARNRSSDVKFPILA
jgi:hypothetical protein